MVNGWKNIKQRSLRITCVKSTGYNTKITVVSYGEEVRHGLRRALIDRTEKQGLKSLEKKGVGVGELRHTRREARHI